MLIAYWHMFTTGETYHDPGGDYFQRRDPETHTRRLIRKLEQLSHTVTLTPTAALTQAYFPSGLKDRCFGHNEGTSKKGHTDVAACCCWDGIRTHWAPGHRPARRLDPRSRPQGVTR